MAIRFRNPDNKVVQALSSEFTLQVVGADIESGCADASLTIISGANDQSLSFKALAAGETDAFADIRIEDAFKVEMEGGDDTCQIEFELQTQSPIDQQWYRWDQVQAFLEFETGSYVTIYAYIEQQENGKVSFGGHFNHLSVEAIRSLYLQSGVSKINFRILGNIAGSTTDGRQVPVASKAKAEFSIKLVD
jgi:hypothetical protein